MAFTTRAARSEDLESIAEWTRDTFDWGDYVPDRFQTWLDDPAGEVIVCVDEADVPLALANAKMLSPTEGWLEGARVHPLHKRGGMGTAMNAAGVKWARERGARVVRLATEADNLAANSQVEKLGYRLGSTWVAGFLDEPDYRARADETLSESRPGDVDSAWMAWSTSELAAVGREMIHEGWQWRSATVDDLRDAASAGRMFQSRFGWAIQRDLAAQFETTWIGSAPEDLPGMLAGLIDRAAAGGYDRMVIKLPSLEWASEAMSRSGFRLNEIRVYYLAT